VPQADSGLCNTGDVKSLQIIKVKDEPHLLIGVNNVGIRSYKVNQK